MHRYALVFLIACAAPANADIISPDQEACFDKKAGDACTTCVSAVDTAMCGTCVTPPPSCQAGACRRFADQATCLAEPGCSWETGRPVCSGAPCACNTKDAQAPATPADDKASSCASGAPLSGGALVIAATLALVRRRGRRGGLHH